MVDTVNFRIERVDVSGGNPFEILPYLSETTERQSEKYGYSCSGKIAWYDVHVYQWGIYMIGSLAKSYFEGDNIGTMTRRSTQNAVEKLSDLLHTDIGMAKVVRVDMASVFPTNCPPCDYFSYLGDKPHFKRLQATPDTLYYKNHQRELCFYDKAKEAKEIPETLQNCNLLRYELRFLHRVDRQLKAEVTAKLLHEERFYTSLVDKWRDEFMSIQKINKVDFMTNNIVTVKDAESALFAYALQQLGQSTIDEFLNDLKTKGTFKDPKYYSRLKASLNKVFEARKGQKSELIKELESNVWNWSAYAR
jgi:thiol-disulfide isomerase/thioredoxin